MTDGEGKNTWRADRYSPCPRQEAGSYLAFLASLGYQLSDIEQAVADGVPYTGEARPDDQLAAGDDPASPGIQPGLASAPAPRDEDIAGAAGSAAFGDEPEGTGTTAQTAA